MFIKRDPATVSSRDVSPFTPPITPDNEAAVRAELLRQIETSSRELEIQLAALRYAGGSHALLDQGDDKLRHLNSLRDQLVGGAKGVAALRAEITSAVADTHAYTSGVGSASGTAQAAGAEQAALRAASNAARATVVDFNRDFYERKIFDPYLRFASTEDEEAYRRREDEYRRGIAAARAENTPEGDLRATQLSLDQLHDAGAHGAKRSAAYRGFDDRLTASHDRLAHAIAVTPHSDRSARAEQRDGAKPDQKVAPEVLAALREAGITIPDQGGSGHGVTRGKPADRTIQPT